MQFIARYMRYLSDNPEQYWFKRKLYGWGWVPVTWQGWAALLVFIAIYTAVLVQFLEGPEPTGTDMLWFLAKVVAIFAALIGVCYLTGQPPKWQWGLPNNTN